MKTTAIIIQAIATALFCACGANFGTGAIEEEELYNTLGLNGAPLFDEQGLAPQAFAPEAFRRAGVMWDADDGCVLEARVMDSNGRWSDWAPLVASWSEGIAHNGYVELGERGVAFQLRHVSGPRPFYLLAEAIGEVGEAPAGGGDEGPYGTIEQALAPSNLVHPRSDWGARAPACSSGSHNPSKITVHHTATPLPDSMSPQARLRQIQNYHISTRGWCDIGYHFLVDWNGELWQGRNETVIGAHVADNNTNNVGISFMGTYNSTSPTSRQLSRTADLMAWLHGRYGIPMNRSYVWGHRQYRGNAAGDCPGDRLYAKLGDLCTMAAGGGGGGGGDTGGGGGGNGTLQGVVFEDRGSGTNDMSHRLPGATVRLNTGASKTASAGDAFWSFSVPAGNYTVTASLSGYQTSSRSCSVTGGGSVWCSIGLVKAASNAKGTIQGVVFEDIGVGTNDMSRRLPGATVRFSTGGSLTAQANDAYWSAEVPAGSVTVTASMSGYQSRSRTCTVTQNGSTWCSVGLVRVTTGGGDTGGGDTGGGDTGGGDTGGGDTGGGDTGGGDVIPCGTDPTGDPSKQGKLFGRAVIFDPANPDPATSVPVGDVEIAVEGMNKIVKTCAGGGYEYWAEPGERVVAAKKEGFVGGTAVCTVVVGQTVECNVWMVPITDTSSGAEEPQPIGCATAGQTPAGLSLLALLLLSARRRTR